MWITWDDDAAFDSKGTRMLRLALALAAASLIATPVMAAPCRNAKGMFIKCPTKTVVVKKVHCRDAKGHFKKC